MYDVGPVILYFEYFILIGAIISFIYYNRKKSKLSKRIFLTFASILVVEIAVLFIIFILFLAEVFWYYLVRFSPSAQ